VNTDPEIVRDVFASHYFFFAFMASLGTLQIATSNSVIRGLWLIPHRRLTRWLGVALILAGIAVFFAQPLWIEGPWAAGSVEADSVSREWGQADWGDLGGARNVNDIDGGLDGTKQAIWFPLAAILAFAVSAVVGTLSVKILMKDAASDATAKDNDLEITGGLAGMVLRSYFANLPDSLRSLRSEIVDDWRTGLHAADKWSLFRMIFGRS